MIGLSWLVLALGGSVQATEFQLDTDTPDSLCPELSMTREAVRQRLGQLETEAGGRWHGLYSNVHDPTGHRGDYVRLIIRDAEGREQLKRELPLKGESCETLAQAIALVVDGYFRELAQAPVHDESAEKARASTPGTEPGARTNVTVPPAPPVSKPATFTAPTRQRSNRLQVGLALGGGYESVPAKSAGNIGLSIGRPQEWRWQLQVGVPFSNVHEEQARGAASGYVLPARLSLSFVTEPVKRLQWLIGPEALLSLEHGATQDVPAGRSGWRLSPGVGARTTLAFWVTQSVALAAELAADEVLFESRRFLMYEQPVLEFSRTRLSGTVGLWAVIWP